MSTELLILGLFLASEEWNYSCNKWQAKYLKNDIMTPGFLFKFKIFSHFSLAIVPSEVVSLFVSLLLFALWEMKPAPSKCQEPF
jgi:hypothetical protein